MRLFADSNIVALAVRTLRSAGYDVIYAGERAWDPGDEALLAEAAAAGRVFVTKDHDIGALVYRDQQSHSGVLLLDDLGHAVAETAMILAAMASHGDKLAAGVFLRATEAGVRNG